MSILEEPPRCHAPSLIRIHDTRVSEHACTCTYTRMSASAHAEKQPVRCRWHHQGLITLLYYNAR
jgi:hypothetical protein